jgi:hypothetical protein
MTTVLGTTSPPTQESATLTITGIPKVKVGEQVAFAVRIDIPQGIVAKPVNNNLGRVALGGYEDLLRDDVSIYFSSDESTQTELRLHVSMQNFEIDILDEETQPISRNGGTVSWDVSMTAKPGARGRQDLRITIHQKVPGVANLPANATIRRWVKITVAGDAKPWPEQTLSYLKWALPGGIIPVAAAVIAARRRITSGVKRVIRRVKSVIRRLTGGDRRSTSKEQGHGTHRGRHTR